MKNEFTSTYVNGKWRSNESKSGKGSELAFTVNYRKYLLKIIKGENIQSMFDTSCGDWNWMKEIKDELPIYVGNDIVEPLIEDNIVKYGSDKVSFTCEDVLTQLKSYGDKEFDLIICRHTLEHLPTKYVINTLNEIRRVSNYGIITSSSGDNIELNRFDGRSARPVNLNKSPYKEIVGEVYKLFVDTHGEDLGDYTTKSEGCFGYVYKF